MHGVVQQDVEDLRQLAFRAANGDRLVVPRRRHDLRPGLLGRRPPGVDPLGDDRGEVTRSLVADRGRARRRAVGQRQREKAVEDVLQPFHLGHRRLVRRPFAVDLGGEGVDAQTQRRQGVPELV